MSIAYRPTFQRTARLVRWLAEASALRSWILSQTVDVSWLAPARREAMVRSAHFSTRIEGNPLTLPQVGALAEGRDVPAEARAKREILNYFAALRWIWRSSPPRRLGETSLLLLHRLLVRGVVPAPEAGAYKTRPNAVVQGSRVIYRPPPPEAAAILTRSLLRWMNSDECREEHPAVAAAVVHHRMVSIHPFMDGNGRTARALESWLLFRSDFDTHHIFALDEYFESDRGRYYEKIQDARRRDGDLTRWVEYVGEGIVETLRKTQRRIQSLQAGRPSGRRMVVSRPQERILQALSELPGIGGGELARTLGMTRSHLSKLIQPLIRGGLIHKEGSTKAARYRPAPPSSTRDTGHGAI